MEERDFFFKLIHHRKIALRLDHVISMREGGGGRGVRENPEQISGDSLRVPWQGRVATRARDIFVRSRSTFRSTERTTGRCHAADINAHVRGLHLTGSKNQ